MYILKNYLKIWKVKIYAGSVIFELENKLDLRYVKKDRETGKAETTLKVKGQMKLIDDLNIILFLGHPM